MLLLLPLLYNVWIAANTGYAGGPQLDPCNRQPFVSSCMHANGSTTRSQFVLRYYRRGSQCVSYPYGYCRRDPEVPELYKYKDECVKNCVNMTFSVIAGPQEEIAQITVQPATLDTNVETGVASSSAPTEFTEEAVIRESAFTERQHTTIQLLQSPPAANITETRGTATTSIPTTSTFTIAGASAPVTDIPPTTAAAFSQQPNPTSFPAVAPTLGALPTFLQGIDFDDHNSTAAASVTEAVSPEQPASVANSAPIEPEPVVNSLLPAPPVTEELPLAEGTNAYLDIETAAIDNSNVAAVSAATSAEVTTVLPAQSTVTNAEVATVLPAQSTVTNAEVATVLPAQSTVTNAEVATVLTGQSTVTNAEVATVLTGQITVTNAEVATVLTGQSTVTNAEVATVLTGQSTVTNAEVATVLTGQSTVTIAATAGPLSSDTVVSDHPSIAAVATDALNGTTAGQANAPPLASTASQLDFTYSSAAVITVTSAVPTVSPSNSDTVSSTVINAEVATVLTAQSTVTSAAATAGPLSSDIAASDHPSITAVGINALVGTTAGQPRGSPAASTVSQVDSTYSSTTTDPFLPAGINWLRHRTTPIPPTELVTSIEGSPLGFQTTSSSPPASATELPAAPNAWYNVEPLGDVDGYSSSAIFSTESLVPASLASTNSAPDQYAAAVPNSTSAEISVTTVITTAAGTDTAVDASNPGRSGAIVSTPTGPPTTTYVPITSTNSLSQASNNLPIISTISEGAISAGTVSATTSPIPSASFTIASGSAASTVLDITTSAVLSSSQQSGPGSVLAAAPTLGAPSTSSTALPTTINADTSASSTRLGLIDLLPTSPSKCAQQRLTALERQQSNVVSESTGRPVSVTIDAGFLPKCTPAGSFEEVQCDSGSNYCWCVDAEDGVELPGTRTQASRGRPQCYNIASTSSSPPPQPLVTTCDGQPDAGPCKRAVPLIRWHYDPGRQSCLSFHYGGCGGNGNNYESKRDCESQCVYHEPPTCSKGAKPLNDKEGDTFNCVNSTCPVGWKCTFAKSVAVCCPEEEESKKAGSLVDACRLPKDRGTCDKYELRFYYNSEVGGCKYFFYGGCGGNANNFKEIAECERVCGVGHNDEENQAPYGDGSGQSEALTTAGAPDANTLMAQQFPDFALLPTKPPTAASSAQSTVPIRLQFPDFGLLPTKSSVAPPTSTRPPHPAFAVLRARQQFPEFGSVSPLPQSTIAESVTASSSTLSSTLADGKQFPHFGPISPSISSLPVETTSAPNHQPSTLRLTSTVAVPQSAAATATPGTTTAALHALTSPNLLQPKEQFPPFNLLPTKPHTAVVVASETTASPLLTWSTSAPFSNRVQASAFPDFGPVSLPNPLSTPLGTGVRTGSTAAATKSSPATQVGSSDASSSDSPSPSDHFNAPPGIATQPAPPPASDPTGTFNTVNEGAEPSPNTLQYDTGSSTKVEQESSKPATIDFQEFGPVPPSNPNNPPPQESGLPTRVSITNPTTQRPQTRHDINILAQTEKTQVLLSIDNSAVLIESAQSLAPRSNEPAAQSPSLPNEPTAEGQSQYNLANEPPQPTLVSKAAVQSPSQSSLSNEPTAQPPSESNQPQAQSNSFNQPAAQPPQPNSFSEPAGQFPPGTNSFSESAVQSPSQSNSFTDLAAQQPSQPGSFNVPAAQPPSQPGSFNAPAAQPPSQPGSFNAPDAQPPSHLDSFNGPAVQPPSQPDSFNGPAVQPPPQPDSFNAPAAQPPSHIDSFNGPAAQPPSQRDSFNEPAAQQPSQPNLLNEPGTQPPSPAIQPPSPPNSFSKSAGQSQSRPSSFNELGAQLPSQANPFSEAAAQPPSQPVSFSESAAPLSSQPNLSNEPQAELPSEARSSVHQSGERPHARHYINRLAIPEQEAQIFPDDKVPPLEDSVIENTDLVQPPSQPNLSSELTSQPPSQSNSFNEPGAQPPSPATQPPSPPNSFNEPGAQPPSQPNSFNEQGAQPPSQANSFSETAAQPPSQPVSFSESAAQFSPQPNLLNEPAAELPSAARSSVHQSGERPHARHYINRLAVPEQEAEILPEDKVLSLEDPVIENTGLVTPSLSAHSSTQPLTKISSRPAVIQTGNGPFGFEFPETKATSPLTSSLHSSLNAITVSPNRFQNKNRGSDSGVNQTSTTLRPPPPATTSSESVPLQSVAEHSTGFQPQFGASRISAGLKLRSRRPQHFGVELESTDTIGTVSQSSPITTPSSHSLVSSSNATTPVTANPTTFSISHRNSPVTTASLPNIFLTQPNLSDGPQDIFAEQQGAFLPGNRCSHPQDAGPCSGRFIRWYWDSTKRECDVFTYGGCQGNGNNFGSREECQNACRELPGDICLHPPGDGGECPGKFTRFAYISADKSCREFIYGGCGGNGNNFGSAAECESSCRRSQSQKPCAHIVCADVCFVITRNSGCQECACPDYGDESNTSQALHNGAVVELLTSSDWEAATNTTNGTSTTRAGTSMTTAATANYSLDTTCIIINNADDVLNNSSSCNSSDIVNNTTMERITEIDVTIDQTVPAAAAVTSTSQLTRSQVSSHLLITSTAPPLTATTTTATEWEINLQTESSLELITPVVPETTGNDLPSSSPLTGQTSPPTTGTTVFNSGLLTTANVQQRITVQPNGLVSTTANTNSGVFTNRPEESALLNKLNTATGPGLVLFSGNTASREPGLGGNNESPALGLPATVQIPAEVNQLQSTVNPLRPPQVNQLPEQGNQLQPQGNQLQPQGNQLQPQENQLQSTVNPLQPPQISQLPAQGNQLQPQINLLQPQENQLQSEVSTLQPLNNLSQPPPVSPLQPHAVNEPQPPAVAQQHWVAPALNSQFQQPIPSSTLPPPQQPSTAPAVPSPPSQVPPGAVTSRLAQHSQSRNSFALIADAYEVVPWAGAVTGAPAQPAALSRAPALPVATTHLSSATAPASSPLTPAPAVVQPAAPSQPPGLTNAQQGGVEIARPTAVITGVLPGNAVTFQARAARPTYGPPSATPVNTRGETRQPVWTTLVTQAAPPATTATQLPLNICLHPKDAGRCARSYNRFWYDISDNTCKQFVYSGCKGNGNNFFSMKECEKLCVSAAPPAPPAQPAPVQPPAPAASPTVVATSAAAPGQASLTEATAAPATAAPSVLPAGSLFTVPHTTASQFPQPTTVGGTGLTSAPHGTTAAAGGDFPAALPAANPAPGPIETPIGQTSVPAGQSQSTLQSAQVQAQPAVQLASSATLSPHPGPAPAASQSTTVGPGPAAAPTQSSPVSTAGSPLPWTRSTACGARHCHEDCLPVTNRGGCVTCACPPTNRRTVPTRANRTAPVTIAPMDNATNASLSRDSMADISGAPVSTSSRSETDKCTQPLDAGPCKGPMKERYWYNAQTGKCEPFMYGGCAGNRNHFYSLSQCELHCSKGAKPASSRNHSPKAPAATPPPGYTVSQPPAQAATSGPSTASPAVEAPAQTPVAPPAAAAGDAVPEEADSPSPTPAAPDPPPRPAAGHGDVCGLAKDQGPCTTFTERWYHNPTSRKCETFQFGSCGGNNNNFESVDLCKARCVTGAAALGINVPPQCAPDKDPGSCKGYNARWYYNSRNMRCEQFIYGGCDGNSNNFETQGECESACPIERGTGQAVAPAAAPAEPSAPQAAPPSQPLAPAPAPVETASSVDPAGSVRPIAFGSQPAGAGQYGGADANGGAYGAGDGGAYGGQGQGSTGDGGAYGGKGQASAGDGGAYGGQGQGQASAGDGGAYGGQGQGQASAGDGGAYGGQGQGQASAGDGGAYGGQGQGSTGDGGAYGGKGQASAGDGGAYGGQGQASAGDGGAYGGQGQASAGDGGAYGGQGQGSTGDGGAYGGKGQASAGDGGAYGGQGQASAGDGGAYGGQGQASAGDGGAYGGKGQASAGDGGAYGGQGQGQASAGDGGAYGGQGQGQASAGDGGAYGGQGQASAGDGGAYGGQGQASAGDGRAYGGQGQGSSGDGGAYAGQGQASAGDNGYGAQGQAGYSDGQGTADGGYGGNGQAGAYGGGASYGQPAGSNGQETAGAYGQAAGAGGDESGSDAGGYGQVSVPSCPNGGFAMRHPDGGTMSCLPGRESCPPEGSCNFNGLNFFCCPGSTDDQTGGYVAGQAAAPAIGPSSAGGYGGDQSASGQAGYDGGYGARWRYARGTGHHGPRRLRRGKTRPSQ